jgi:hypothetical protein
VKDGVLTGQLKSPDDGWLVLDQSMANVGFYAKILYAGDC